MSPQEQMAFVQKMTQPQRQALLQDYHQSLIGEIEQLIDQTQTAAKRASDVVNAGVERRFWASANR